MIGATRQLCPTCDRVTAVFEALVGAPGYGQAGRCTACGAQLWRATAHGTWSLGVGIKPANPAPAA
jgi:hypothetical protein